MNQRIIKFRAWDKRFKQIVTVDEMSWSRVWKKATPAIAYVEFPATSYDWDENVTIMQFTGLLDKNGKEIWEGDIVSDGYNRNEVVFEEYTDGEYEGHYYGYCLLGKASGEVEVIGNRFEHPELLTPPTR